MCDLPGSGLRCKMCGSFCRAAGCCRKLQTNSLAWGWVGGRLKKVGCQCGCNVRQISNSIKNTLDKQICPQHYGWWQLENMVWGEAGRSFDYKPSLIKYIVDKTLLAWNEIMEIDMHKKKQNTEKHKRETHTKSQIKRRGENPGNPVKMEMKVKNQKTGLQKNGWPGWADSPIHCSVCIWSHVAVIVSRDLMANRTKVKFSPTPPWAGGEIKITKNDQKTWFF